MNEKIMVEEEEVFYQAVAETLGCAGHSYRKFPYSKRTRWNNRAPGNGRYPGFGLVRRFGSTNVVVQLHTPRLHKHFKNTTDALLAIQLALLFDKQSK